MSRGIWIVMMIVVIWKLLVRQYWRKNEERASRDSSHCFPPLLGLMNRIALAYSARLASKEDAEEQERLRVAAEKKARMKAAAKSGGNAR